MYNDKALKNYVSTNEIKVYRQKDTIYKKGVVVNPYGGVLGFANESGKNNLNKTLTTHVDMVSTYYYSIIVEGQEAHFKININLEKL
jgi:hypothetical protein